MAKKETCPNCGHNPRTDHVLMKAEIAALTRQLSQRDARIKQLRKLLSVCASVIRRAAQDGDLRHGAKGCSSCTNGSSCFAKWHKLAAEAAEAGNG